MSETTITQALLTIIMACIGGLSSGVPLAFALYKGISSYLHANAEAIARIIAEALEMQHTYDLIDARVGRLEADHTRNNDELWKAIDRMNESLDIMNQRQEKIVSLLIDKATAVHDPSKVSS